MSHHYSGPDFSFPHRDARLDFTDLYALPKPGDTGRSVLIMNVHQSDGENPPGATTTEPSHPKRCMSSRLIPIGMRLPTSRTVCASQHSSEAHKPQFSTALMARKPPGLAMADG